jgi:Leucine-rich repeat (LRR) protein
MAFKIKTISGVGYLSNLINLRLEYNDLTDEVVNDLVLPNSLEELSLSDNQIINFNPSIALPNSLQQLYLGGNQMTIAGYTSSEPWANAMTVIPDRGVIYFGGNVDSVSGTTLETILIAKGWNVNP